MLGRENKAAERRRELRQAVNCPVTVAPLTGAARISGHLVDLSMGGCRLETDNKVMITIRMRVELQFQLRGIGFRIVGVSLGARGGRLYAVRFQEMTERRRVELRELLDEVAAVNARKAAAEAEKPVPVAGAEPVVEPEVVQPVVAPVEEKKLPAEAPVEPVSARTASAGSPTEVKNLRAHNRHNVDTGARLLLVNSGISMASRIQDLSLGGCKLHTNERFNVGIYVRVETEFYLQGLPFRLGGVSQVIVDRHTIGIRFLDMSSRKREQLQELISEIAESEAQLPSVDEVTPEVLKTVASD